MLHFLSVAATRYRRCSKRLFAAERVRRWEERHVGFVMLEVSYRQDGYDVESEVSMLS
jgi:hypothetical protein